MFICPHCQQPTLHIIKAIELPPDGDSDEITLQLIRCGTCHLHAAAVYQESRRGGASWHHFGHYLQEDGFEQLSSTMACCLRPHDRACGCPAHQTLGLQEGGCWVGLDRTGVLARGFFPIRR
jgi:hypothetical protein